MPSGNQETLYRVNIGPYDKPDADKVATELATEGRKGIMILPWTQN
jgi:cell division protein FtsN